MNKYELLRKMVESGEAERYFADDLETTVQNLQAAGLDFSPEELQALAMAYRASLTEDGELPLEQLDMVAGGAWKLPNPFKGIKLGDLFRKGKDNWFGKYLNNLEKITRGNF